MQSKKLNRWQSLVAVGSTHSLHNPNTVRNQRRLISRTCPYVAPLYRIGGYVHNELRSAVIDNAGVSERFNVETRITRGAGRADLTTTETVFEFKSTPDLYNCRAGIMQVYHYSLRSGIKNPVLMLPLTRNKLFFYDAYGMDKVRAEILWLAEKFGIKIIVSPSTDIPEMEISDGFANVFEVSKHFGLSIFALYSEVSLRTIRVARRVRIKDDIKVCVEDVKRIFNIH